jgi:hypothetical protein
MIPMVNLNNNIEKELEMERQGMNRTRRWIGDATQVTDTRWYQARAYRPTDSKTNLDKIGQISDNQPRREAFNSILTRFSNLLSYRRHPIGSKS